MIKQLFSSTLRIAIILALFVLLLVLNYHVWKKDHQQEKVIKELQHELQIQQQENVEIAKTNADLKDKITSLERGRSEMIEEEARKNWGMVGEDETFFHLEEKVKP